MFTQSHQPDFTCTRSIIVYAAGVKTRSDKRTTVSLASVVWQMAEELMETKGFNDNFSAYVADLIRRDQERIQAASNVPPIRYATPAAAETLNDKPVADAQHSLANSLTGEEAAQLTVVAAALASREPESMKSSVAPRTGAAPKKSSRAPKP